MRLSLVLFRRNRMPHGHIFRGKERLIKEVEPRHLRKMKQDFALEEKNMFYLRFPYITEEESHGLARALGNTHESRFEKLLDKERRRFKKDVTLYERLGHLRVNEGWD